MSKHHTDRERWEVFILIVLLATRPFLFGTGVLLFIYAVAAWLAYPIVGVVALSLASYLFALFFSDQVALYTARFGAWLATI